MFLSCNVVTFFYHIIHGAFFFSPGGARGITLFVACGTFYAIALDIVISLFMSGS